MARCYVRNGVWGWSVPEQERTLAASELWDAGRVYRDILPTRQAKMPGRVRAEWLEERAALLRPTSRGGGDVIAVATMLVLGISEADLVAALAGAAARRATVVAVDSGVSIAPDAGAAGVALAVEDWQRAKQVTRTKPGRIKGNIAASEAKKRRTLAKLPEARKLWGLPTEEIATEDIAERVGLSVKTLYTYLGRREVAQRRSKRKK